MLSYLGKQTVPGPVWPLGDGLCDQGSSWKVLPVLLVRMHWGKGRGCLPGRHSIHSDQTCFQRKAPWSSLQMNLDPDQELESHSQRYPGKCLRQNPCLSSRRPHRYSSCCCCNSTWHKCDAKLHHLGRTLCKESASRGWWAPTGFVPACPTGPSVGTHWWRQAQHKRRWSIPRSILGPTGHGCTHWGVTGQGTTRWRERRPRGIPLGSSKLRISNL